MARRSKKSTKGELKREVRSTPTDTPRVFNLVEIQYIRANASLKTLSELAVDLGSTKEEVQEMINQYNGAVTDMLKQSFQVGKGSREGVIVPTQATSEMSDELKKNGFGLIHVKAENPNVFYMKKNQ